METDSYEKELHKRKLIMSERTLLFMKGVLLSGSDS